MAHYAKISEGIVVNIIASEQDCIDTMVDTSPGIWLQASYNTLGGVHKLGGTPLRKNFPGIGFTYDATRDAFYGPQPYESWTLNNTTCLWEAPVAWPDDDKVYNWNETTQAWDEIT